jgi:hypothetical protein
MKNLGLTIAFIFTVGAVSFLAFYYSNREDHLERARTEPVPVAWIREEFGLTDAQFASISLLHETYLRTCAEHCDRILAARAAGMPAAEIAVIESECVDSMTRHFRAVAALMPANAGARYLDLVLPKIASFDHRTAPDILGASGQ